MPVFLSFFPKNRHFEMGSNCDVLTLKRTSFSTFFVVGRSNHLPTTSAFFRQIPSVSIYTKKLEINLAAMPRGFESHRLRQRQHLAGRCFLFLQQTMQGLQGGIRTARARRFASRRAATVLRTVARARENPTVCAKYHYSILHWVVIFCCRFAKFRCFLIGISPLFSSSDFRVRYKSYQQSRQIAIHRTTQDFSCILGTN